MTYESTAALRAALEARLRHQSDESGVSLDRLRRRVVFERVIARLELADPGRWVLKGGMALEVRLRDRARLTKDVDLGLREVVDDSQDLYERLVEALDADPLGDRFILTAPPLAPLSEDGGGFLTWRTTVEARLAGTVFGWIKLDISPRAHELEATDRMALPNSLAFAQVSAPDIEVVDVNRHAAEKLHAMQRDFGDRENSRVRDLVDVVILIEEDLIDRVRLSEAVRTVWRERDRSAPPGSFVEPPASWRERYEQLADESDLQARSFSAAVTAVTALWSSLSIDEES